jgi:hypothetical protein
MIQLLVTMREGEPFYIYNILIEEKKTGKRQYVLPIKYVIDR